MTNQERIFVQIASYRDPDCQWTIRDMFDNASEPGRIYAGICWQFVPEEDSDCFVEVTWPEHVRKVEFHARDSKGVCWARQQTQRLWRGEEYTLQIDSHMRFEPGWDERLIAMLKSCATPRAVLSTYPMGFNPPRDLPHRGVLTKIVAKEFDAHGILILGNHAFPAAERKPSPMLNAYVGGCFYFGPGKMIADVPYDPYLYFFGEEASLSARLWTHGYDIYAPNEAVLYHDWSRKGRPLHWDDSSEWERLTSRAFARVRHLFGTERSTDPDVLRDLELYSFGTARSLSEYEAFTGISFQDRMISERAKSPDFPVAVARSSITATIAAAPIAAATVSTVQAAMGNVKPLAAPAIIPPLDHHPKKILENDQIIVYDEFIAPHLYDRIQAWALHQDYYHINTSGQINKTWRLHDGFPMRSVANTYYVAGKAPERIPGSVYPSNNAFDLLVEQIMRTMPDVSDLVGAALKDWNHFSVSSFAYPRDTGLSLHHDGNNVYSGAFTFFVSPVWNIHWGGLLMVFDKRTTVPPNYVDLHGIGNVWKPIWIDQEYELALSYDPGIATTIVPLPNRMVFIQPNAYHMITTVTASAGDYVRMAWSGFFTR